MYPGIPLRRIEGCRSILLGLIFMVVGGGMFFYFSSSYFNSLSFSEARCTILAKSIVTSTSSNGENYRPQFSLYVQPNNGTAAYQTKSNYNLTQGSTSNYGKVAGIVDRFVIGEQYQCWYSPQNPFVTVLDRSPNLLVISIAALFTYIGFMVFLVAIGRLIGIGLLVAWIVRVLRR